MTTFMLRHLLGGNGALYRPSNLAYLQIKKMLAKSMLAPTQSVFFPMSQPMVGSVIPGVLRRYPTKTVNYPDHTSAVEHRKTFNPVQQHLQGPKGRKVPSMHGPLTKGHPTIELLRQLLEKKKTQFKPGYEPIKEDLSWRGRSRPQNLLEMYP